MVISEILKKVRGTVITSKTALSGSRAGAFKVSASGSGYDFDQLREYQEGDDYRRIDWKSSARTQSLLLRDYKDERNRTMHAIVDISSSMHYGSQKLLLSDVARELAAALLMIGAATDDALSLQYVTHHIHKNFAPRSGKHHMVQLLRSLQNFTHEHETRSLKTALETFIRRYRKRALVFIITDCIDEGYETPLRILAQHHEVALIRVRDVRENHIGALPGSFMCQDSERTTSLLEQGLLGSDATSALQRWREDQARFLNSLALTWCDCCNDGQHLDQLLKFIRRFF